MDLMVKRYRFGKGRHMKQTNDIRDWQKKMAEFCRLTEKVNVYKESGVMTQGRKRVEVVTLLHVAHFGTKW